MGERRESERERRGEWEREGGKERRRGIREGERESVCKRESERWWEIYI